MNHEDVDDDVFAIVADGFTSVDLDTSLERVTARGRRLRTRRRAMTGAATMGVAAVAALAVALPGTAQPGASRSAPSALSSPPQRAVNVHLAAWSMASNANGTVTLTFHDFTDLDQLRQSLAQAGIHALVEGRLPTCGGFRSMRPASARR